MNSYQERRRDWPCEALATAVIGIVLNPAGLPER